MFRGWPRSRGRAGGAGHDAGEIGEWTREDDWGSSSFGWLGGRRIDARRTLCPFGRPWEKRLLAEEAGRPTW